MFRTLAIFSFFLVLPINHAARAAEIRLTLDNAPAYALKRNPSLAAARLRIEEARGRFHQSGRLANPEVELGWQQNVRTPENTFGALFFQRFPVTGRLRLERAVTRAQLAAAVAEVRNEERKLAVEVCGAVVRLLALQEQRALRDRQIGNGRELAGFLNLRAAAGEATRLDASLVDLENRQIEVEQLGLDVEQAARLGELRLLLGAEPGTKIILADGLPGLTGLAAPGAGADPSRRPDFVAAQRHADAAQQEVRLARAQRWGDVGVGLNVETERSEDAPDGLERDTLAGLRINVPLPLWNDNAGRIHEAAAAAARAEGETRALALGIHTEAAAARDEMAALARLVREIDEQLLPKATEIEKQVRAAFDAGQAPLPDAMRARDRRLTFQRQRLDALRDFHLARVRHRAVTGAILPDRSGAK
jgi:cobalt-zinc-cadmium efflux system outer membrane protein